jgi:hypothetical protein
MQRLYFSMLRPNVVQILYGSFLAKELDVYWSQLGLIAPLSSQKEIDAALREQVKYNIRYGYISCMERDVKNRWVYKHLYSDCLSVAAKYGNIRSLDWLSRVGYCWDESIIAIATRYGHFDAVKWLCNNGCTPKEYTSAIAAQHGRLEILQWLLMNGGCFDNTICEYAARGGHADIIIWLLSRKAVLTERVSHAAAQAGNTEMLIWLLSHDCPRIDTDIISTLSKQGLLSERILLWLQRP